MMCHFAIGQSYDRYRYFYDEAVKLKNEGKLDEAKEKFKKIKVICQGGIPADNDLDRMIRECTTISLSESSLKFDADGGMPKSVTVRVNADGFKVNSNMRWCRAFRKGNSLVVSCDGNPLPAPRSAIVSIVADGKSSSLGVSQMGSLLELEVRPDTVRFSKQRETVAVAVATNAESWYVDSIPYWIDYQVEDSVLYLESMANTVAQIREAVVYVVAADEWFPIRVSQAESDTTISVDKEVMVFPCSQSEACLAVESNIGHWQVQTSDDWIRLFSVYNDTVWVQVEQNPSLFSRHGWIRIGMGSRFCEVPVHQYASASEMPSLKSEIDDNDAVNKKGVAVTSEPSELKVTIIGDGGLKTVRRTPFEMPIDYGHYTLQMGFEKREVFANEQQKDVAFEPGMRFATLTWSPKLAVGLMSGFVGAKSWGAFAHFQATTPFVTEFGDATPELSGYNITFGPVFRPKGFPFVGVYAGVGAGCYGDGPWAGLDYEAGVMGFYKHVVLSMGFHTTRLNASSKITGFMLGVGGYLKRYYDSELGYCAGDSRRWFSLNYMFRPSEGGKGLMVGDVGKDKLRVYFKGMYFDPMPSGTDSIANKHVEAGIGMVFTPVDGFIDICMGAAADLSLAKDAGRFQGVGAEVGAILNVWRFPLTVMLHEVDIFGDRHLCIDFGIGFHFGKFGKSNSSYQ